MHVVLPVADCYKQLSVQTGSGCWLEVDSKERNVRMDKKPEIFMSIIL